MTTVNNRLARILIRDSALSWIEVLTFNEHSFNRQNGTVKLDKGGWREYLDKHKIGPHEMLIVDIQFTDGPKLALTLWLDGALPHGSGTVKVQVHPPE